MVSVSVYLFYQPIDEKIKTWSPRFPAKENPNMKKVLFDWPIVLRYDVKAKYRLISRKFSGMKIFHPSVRLTNQKPRAFVCNQPNRSISVHLLFLFCSRVSISSSFEDRPIPFCKTYIVLFYQPHFQVAANQEYDLYNQIFCQDTSFSSTRVSLDPFHFVLSSLIYVSIGESSTKMKTERLSSLHYDKNTNWLSSFP